MGHLKIGAIRDSPKFALSVLTLKFGQQECSIPNYKERWHSTERVFQFKSSAGLRCVFSVRKSFLGIEFVNFECTGLLNSYCSCSVHLY